MSETRVLYRPERVTAPGETLAELLDERGMTQTDLARRMGRPVKTVNEIVNGKAAITPETALQLEQVLGTPANYWLTHDAHYRAYLARQERENTFEAHHDWLDQLPMKELKAVGVLSQVHNRGKNKNLLVRESLDFFGTATPDEWDAVYGELQIAYRQSMPEQSDKYARAAWLRLGELQAAQAPIARYDEQRFRAALQTIRALTLLPPEEFEPRLRALCAEAGVTLALVPAIPRARVSGAARWINQRPLIQLSLFGKTNDRFWFTFYHEACHILEHPRKLIFMDEWNDGEISDMEAQADRFAAEVLIPPDSEDELAELKSKVAVQEFARRIGIHPGIVVGRLQHEEIIERSWMNDLKATFAWRDPTYP